MTPSPSPHFLLGEAGPHPRWLLVIRGIDSTPTCIRALFTRSELQSHSGRGLGTAVPLQAQGKWSARITPWGSLCLKCHLCWLVLGSYLVSPPHPPCAPLYHDTSLVSPFSYRNLELLLPACFLVRCLSEPLECEVEGEAGCPGILSQTRSLYPPLLLAKRFFPGLSAWLAPHHWIHSIYLDWKRCA